MRSIFFFAAVTAASLFALPSGHKVQHGKVQVAQQEKNLVIQSGKRAVVNWDKFSVDKGEKVHFQMKNSKSSVLNRVTGGARSDILGKLESNGNVYLLNGKGVLIGKDAQINVNSLVASTLDVLDEEFLRGGELRFFGDEKGSIVNMGNIEGHSVFLLASDIENHGTIQAERVGLATGSKILLRPEGEQRIFIEASNNEETIDNRGTIAALTTEIKNNSPYVLAVRSSGTIDATQTEKRDGKILLIAEKGTVDLDGALRASQVEVSGDQVYLYGNALIEAPQGKVDIGGRTPTRNVVLFPESKITVSAAEKGDAGEVYIYSEGATAHYGIIEACGGAEGGNGGFVELSGKMDLGLEGKIERGAPMGIPGELLIDPKNATITAAGLPLPTPSLTFGVSSAASLTISGASLGTALDSGPVTIECNTDCIFSDTVTTTSSNALTIRAGRSCTFTGTGVFTSAGGDLNISINDTGAIPAERDPGVAAFTTTFGSSITTGGGNVTQTVGTFGSVQQGRVFITSGSIDAGGGDINMEGYRLPSETGVLVAGIDCRAPLTTSGTGSINLTGVAGGGTLISNGVLFVTTTVSVEDGTLTVNGTGGPSTGTLNSGILLFNTTLASTGTSSPGGIDMTGVAGLGSGSSDGITFFSSGNAITTVDGPIVMTGTGNPATTGTGNRGIALASSTGTISSTGAGDITLMGTGGAGTTLCHGIAIVGAGSTITSSGSGEINLNGTAGPSTGLGNSGVVVSTGTITSAAGDISITGLGNTTSSSDSLGSQITGPASAVTSTGSGNIQISGSGGATAGSGNDGVVINGGATVSSVGTGEISLIGTGGAGASMNAGVFISDAATTISSSAGEITLTGVGTGGTSGNNGVEIDSSAAVTGTGSAEISITGTGGGTADDNNGISVLGAATAISVAAGKLTMTGIGADGANGNNGINLVDGMVSSTSGEIELTGFAGSGVDTCVGINSTGTIITSATGPITMRGTGAGTGSFDFGINFSGGAISSTGLGAGAATIFLEGRGSAELADTAVGVVITGSGTGVSSTDGMITINGFGGSIGGDTHGGILVQDSATIDSLGTASIIMRGTGGVGLNECTGIRFGSSSSLTTVDGDVTFTGSGTGTGSNNFGVVWEGSTYSSTGLGSLNVIGTLSSNTSSNAGVIILGGGSLTTADGNITLFGSGNGSVNLNGGSVLGGGSILSTGLGDIRITGDNSSSTGTFSPGIYLFGSSTITSSGTGEITLIGTGGVTLPDAYGIRISDTGTSVTSTVGDISLTGIASGSTEEGMLIELLAEVESLGAAAITAITMSDLIIESGGKIIGGAGLVTVDADRDLTITGSSIGGEVTGVILSTGSANITAGRDLTLTAGTAADTPAQIGSRDASSTANMLFPRVGRNLLIDGGSAASYAIIGHGNDSAPGTSYSGTIRFSSIGGDSTVLGATGFAQLGHFNAPTLDGDIFLTTRGSLTVEGGDVGVGRIGHASNGAFTCTTSDMRLVAGRNIEITSGVADAIVFNPCTGGASDTLTLVVDNDFPTFPTFGSGMFLLNSTQLGTSGGELRIYTVQASQNTINAPVNGQVFAPGAFGVDNVNEQYDIYFPGGSYITSEAFRIYYKVGNASRAALLAPFLANTFYNLSVANSQLNLPLFRYIRLPNYPWYHISFSDNLKDFDPGFDPYSSFIFEDDLYWVGESVSKIL